MTQMNITTDRLLDILDEVLNDNVEVGFEIASNSNPKRYEPVFGIVASDNTFWQARASQTSQADIENDLYDHTLRQGYIVSEEDGRTPNQNLKHYISLALNRYIQDNFKEYLQEHGVTDILM
ncbi:MAG: hypothetical protein JWO03_1169 [Bacteroidetes bacterium]|nr:hypothetical protein [Bacteroidota bacterium]